VACHHDDGKGVVLVPAHGETRGLLIVWVLAAHFHRHGELKMAAVKWKLKVGLGLLPFTVNLENKCYQIPSQGEYLNEMLKYVR
jgi:hypothetical protein